MERVLGIGGVFFRSNAPQALADWYAQHLGIPPAPQNTEMSPWVSQTGAVIFAPFPEDSDYFDADKRFMLNFRVADLDAMLAQLRAAGIEISHEQSLDGIGRFARLHDPEGTPIELWQPPG